MWKKKGQKHKHVNYLLYNCLLNNVKKKANQV